MDDHFLEIKFLRKRLEQYFEAEKWAEFSEALDQLSKYAETQGRVELCLRAQALKEEVSLDPACFSGLLHEISHLEWLSEAS